MASDLLLWAKPLASWVHKVGVPTPCCCPCHPLRNFPAKYFIYPDQPTHQWDFELPIHLKVPAPSWRKGRIVEKGSSVISVVPFVSPLWPEREESWEVSVSLNLYHHFDLACPWRPLAGKGTLQHLCENQLRYQEAAWKPLLKNVILRAKTKRSI